MSELIDAHTHIYPRSYIALLKARTTLPRVTEHEGGERFVIFPEEEAAGAGGGRPFDESYTSLDHKLAHMERNGIDRSVVSLGNPWLDPFNGADSPSIARQLNAELAGYESQTGGKILGMGVLPSNDVGDAVVVAREIAATEGLYGIIVGSRICGLSLDDSDLDPLWSELEQAGLPVFLHPHYAAAGEQLRGFGHALPVSVGFPFETTIALARMIFAGVFYRHQQLKVLAAHGGGAITMLAGRLDAAWRSDPSTHERLPEPPSNSVARLYLDLVLYQERSMRLTHDMVGCEHLSYGTDNPFSVSDPVVNVAAMHDAFTNEERERIAEGTRRLFGLPLH